MATNFPTPRTPMYSDAFPEDLIQNNRNYYTNITIMEYGFGQQGWGVGESGSSIGGSIKLPIPKRINDVETAVWAEASATQMGSQILSQKFGGMVASALGAAASFGGAIAPTGIAANPFQFMMYQRPAYKEYQFSWILTPSSENESSKLNTIINKLKYAALPSQNSFAGGIGSQGALLSYPSTVQISFNPDKYLFKLKPCAITSVIVDYTAAGVPSFFKNTHAPTFVSLTLNLKEIQLQTKDNYGR